MRPRVVDTGGVLGKRDRLRELRDVWREIELLQLDDFGLASVGLHDMHAYVDQQPLSRGALVRRFNGDGDGLTNRYDGRHDADLAHHGGCCLAEAEDLECRRLAALRKRGATRERSGRAHFRQSGQRLLREALRPILITIVFLPLAMRKYQRPSG